MRSELFQIGNLQYWKKNVDFFKCLKICVSSLMNQVLLSALFVVSPLLNML